MLIVSQKFYLTYSTECQRNTYIYGIYEDIISYLVNIILSVIKMIIIIIQCFSSFAFWISPCVSIDALIPSYKT